MGDPSLAEGVLRAGDAILRQPVKYIRTGLIAETVQTMTAYGGDLILPKGAKAYATNYGFINSYTTTPMQGVQKRIDPIEWCVILAAGKDGKQKGPETVCLLYETPERARYMETFDVGGFAFEAFFGSSGMAGPLPVIDEQPVDFAPLRTEIQIQEINNGKVQVAEVLTGGKGSRVLSRRTMKLKAGQSIRLKAAGRELMISLFGEDAVQARLAAPVQESLPSTASPQASPAIP